MLVALPPNELDMEGKHARISAAQPVEFTAGHESQNTSSSRTAHDNVEATTEYPPAKASESGGVAAEKGTATATRSFSAQAAAAAAEEASGGNSHRSLPELLKKYAVPAWILPHLKNPHSWAVVCRCAVAQWAGLMLLLAGPSERYLGQASFLLLVVAVILPPSQPIAPAIVQYGFAILQVGFAWGYGCFAIHMAWLARSTYHFRSQAELVAFLLPRFAAEGIPQDQYATQVQRAIFSGEFMERNSSIVLAVLYGVYCGSLLWFRGWLGPSVHLFAVILAIIVASICHLTAPMFPYPYYLLGWTFFKPFICQIAINTVCLIFIFPESLHHQFLSRLVGVLAPLRTVLSDQDRMLASELGSPEWGSFASHSALLGQVTKGLGLLGVTESLVAQNITYQRATGGDLKRLLRGVRLLNFRASGFVSFNRVLHKQFAERSNDQDVDDLIIHINPSRPPSPSCTDDTRLHDTAHDDVRHDKGLLHSVFKPFEAHMHAYGKERTSRSQSPALSRTSSRAHLAGMHPVGLDETQRYMRLEEALKSADLSYFPHLIAALRESSLKLIQETDSVLEHLIVCFQRMKRTSIFKTLQDTEQAWGINVARNEEIVESLRTAIETYENHDRLAVVRQFDPLFETEKPAGSGLPPIIQPSRRGLFWAYTYQWTLIQYSKGVLMLIEDMTRIEKKRRRQKFQFPPRKAAMRLLHSLNEDSDMHDEDPDHIDGLQSHGNPYLRNPDFIPGSANQLSHRLGMLIWHIGHIATRPDILFGVKAGIFSSLGAFPAFFRSTAAFFYYNRGLWVTIMVALTLSQHVADTVFSWVTRVVATSMGALIGMIVWYIGNGGGHNAYGLAAVCAVAFPIMQAYRIFHTIPLQGILTTVTSVLIIGYSWQDETTNNLSNPGSGFAVAWRRLLLVLIGISIAFVAAFIPPKSTQKKAVRSLYATALTTSGTLLFRLAEIANIKHGPIEHPPAYMKDVIALKTKLVRSAAARDKIRFEISLRGSWPASDYEKLAGLLIETIDYITQLANILFGLDEVWTKAVLRRTRLDDPDFLSSISSAILLCSNALRTGSALPYYHAPLVEDFVKRRFADDDDPFETALPREVDAELLNSMEYLKFSCAISISYAIINRLDRIFLVVKRLVGEDFYIEGLATSSSDDSRQPLLPSHRPPH